MLFFYRSRWFSNIFVRGAYSFPTVQSDQHNLSPDDLAEPLMKDSKPVRNLIF